MSPLCINHLIVLSFSAANTYTPLNTHSLSRPSFENTNPNQHYHLESDETRRRQNQVNSKFWDCGQQIFFVKEFPRGECTACGQHLTLELSDLLVNSLTRTQQKLIFKKLKLGISTSFHSKANFNIVRIQSLVL